MAKQIHQFGPKTRAAIKALLDKDANTPIDNTGDDVIPELSQAPETYIALSSAGIPAMDAPGGTDFGTGDTFVPGSEFCDIYKIVKHNSGTGPGAVVGVLRLAEPRVRVWNLSFDPIAVNTWLLVTRDKFGSWVATGAGGGSSGTTTVVVRATADGATVPCYIQRDNAGVLADTGSPVNVSIFSAPLREDFKTNGYYIAVLVGTHWWAETGRKTKCVNVVGQGTVGVLDCDTLQITFHADTLVPIRVFYEDADCPGTGTGSGTIV